MATTLAKWMASWKLVPESGGPQLTWRAGTNHDGWVLSFAKGEGVDLWTVMPQNYSASADLQMVIYWLTDTSSTGDIIWSSEFLGRIDQETFDAALGTAQTITDSRAVADAVHVATISGGSFSTPALSPGDLTVFHLERSTSGSDTYGADGDFLAAELQAV